MRFHGVTHTWKKHLVPDRGTDIQLRASNSSCPCKVALPAMQNSDSLCQPLFAPAIHSEHAFSV